MAPGISISEQELKKHFSGLSNFVALKTGGQKQVFKCEFNGELLVIKFVEVESFDGQKNDDNAFDRVSREINIMNALQSEYLPKTGGIAPDYYIGKDTKFYFYSEKYIDGPTLRDIINTRKITFEEALSLLVHITTAIKILWENGGNVHRDIKPENIIYNKTEKVFVLIDAGIVLALQETSLTPTGYLIGTIPYMSPEQIKGKKRDLDFRSDLYSLGVTTYEALTQKHPYCVNGMKESEKINKILYFQPTKLNTMNLDMDNEFLEIVENLLNKRPHKRYKSCEKLLDKLSNLSYT